MTFAGAVSLEVDERGVKPWRLPFLERDLFHETLVDRAGMPAGIRLTLLSDTSSIELEVEPITAKESAEEGWCFDLIANGELHQSVQLAINQDCIRFDGLPIGENRLELYLPVTHPVRVRGLKIGKDATANPLHDSRPKWVVYGSSIAHCRKASSPSQTWPDLVARRFGLNLTCLGYGANCQLEPMVARMICDMPAGFIGLCLGINVYNAETLSERTFRSAVIGLIRGSGDPIPVEIESAKQAARHAWR